MSEKHAFTQTMRKVYSVYKSVQSLQVRGDVELFV